VTSTNTRAGGFQAFVQDLLVDDHHEVALGALLVLRELGQRNVEQRQRRVRAVAGLKVEPPDLRVEQVLVGRLLRSVQQLLAVHDLQHAVLVGAVAEVDAVALGPGGDRPVQVGRGRAGRARLLAGQAEAADEHGLLRVGEVVHLRHAARAPALDARDEIGDPGVALPPVLVSVPETF